MFRLWIALILLILRAPVPAWADDRDVALRASPELIETGLMRFMLPRFSLKTGIKIHLSPLEGAFDIAPVADIVLTDRILEPQVANAVAALRRGDRIFYVILPETAAGDAAKAGKFALWLLGDVGQRVVEQFSPGGEQVYAAAAGEKQVLAVVAFEGDVLAGEGVAYQKCGRCHVIGERNRMKGIGSTPSFGVLRSLADWQDRFQTFYTRIPHPSVTQIVGLTAPFDAARPPPIKPVELTQREFDDMLAYVSTVKPADLGAPLQTQ